jgi:hypothetical protein
MARETAKRQIWSLREAISFLEGRFEAPATAVTSPNLAVVATTRKWTSPGSKARDWPEAPLKSRSPVGRETGIVDAAPGRG